LRRRDCLCVIAALGQRSKGHGLVSVFLVDAEEADGCREQLVDRNLHVRHHVTGKLSRGRYQLIVGDACEMPLQRVASIFELLRLRGVAHACGDPQNAAVTDQNGLARQANAVHAGKIAAQFAIGRGLNALQ